jgi:hypothetical protein
MIAKKKREAALALLRAYAAEMRTEIERQTRELSRELERVERSIAELSGDQGDGSETPIPAKAAGPYAGLGPQAAVEKFLKSHPGSLFWAKEIASELKSGGVVVSNPKLVTQQVTVALIRAVNKGVAVEGRKAGKRAFRLHQLPSLMKEAPDE